MSLYEILFWTSGTFFGTDERFFGTTGAVPAGMFKFDCWCWILFADLYIEVGTNEIVLVPFKVRYFVKHLCTDKIS